MVIDEPPWWKSCQHHECKYLIDQGKSYGQPQSQCEWALPTDVHIWRQESFKVVFAATYQMHISESLSLPVYWLNCPCSSLGPWAEAPCIGLLLEKSGMTLLHILWHAIHFEAYTMSACAHQKPCTQMYMAVFFIRALNWKWRKRPSSEEQMSSSWRSHASGYSTALKKNKLLLHATARWVS